MAYDPSKGLVQVKNPNNGTFTSIPHGMIRYETYQITPDQMLDLDTFRSETGLLIRNVLSHSATKIEFNTPVTTSTKWNAVLNIIKTGYVDGKARRLRLRYYDPETDDYKAGWFYRPDIQYTIRNIETDGTINYDEIRVAFIEY